MADINWMAYTGVITGIVGAISGISGGVVSYISYRRVNSIKALDLRLELKKAENSYRSGLVKLAGLIEEADKSHIFLLAATGNSISSSMNSWKQKVSSDKDALSELKGNEPEEGNKYNNLTPDALESKLVETDKYQLQVKGLIEKYEGSIRQDDEMRKHLREQAHNKFVKA